MADKKFIGTFLTEYEVLDKIDALKREGFTENDIYVVTNDTESLSMVQGRTDVDLTTAEGNWLDRFKAFITGDEPVMAAFTNMGYSEEEATVYYNEVKNGRILLYVDKEYNHAVHTYESEMANEHIDANLGSNLFVESAEEKPAFHDGVAADIEHAKQRKMHGGQTTNQVIEENTDGNTPIFKEQDTATKIQKPIDQNSKFGIHDTEPLSEVIRHEELDIGDTEDVPLDYDESEIEMERERLKNNAFTHRDHPL